MCAQDEHRGHQQSASCHPCGVLLIQTQRNCQRELDARLNTDFPPSFLNRKQPWHLSMSAYSPVCMALLSLLLAPALGRKSPTVQCTIIDTSQSQCTVHCMNATITVTLFVLHTRTQRTQVNVSARMLTVARSFSLSGLTKQRLEIADTLCWSVL